MAAIFFDVDGTLLPPPSMERRFLHWLLVHRHIGLRQLWRGAVSLAASVPWSVAAFKANKSYLRGESIERMHSLGAEFVETGIVPALRRQAVQTIAHHLSRRDRVVLVTGSLDLLARPLASSIGIEEQIAGRLEQADGRFTGRLVPPHPYGQGKARALREYAQQAGVDLRQATLYSDSLSDAPAFALMGHRVVVNPPRRMARLARRHRWTIVQWDI